MSATLLRSLLTNPGLTPGSIVPLRDAAHAW
jgi:hypothetical protein